MWQRLKIVFSGHEVPGEGEHKIMGYIRSMKMQPDYNPMTKHCMCGQDADLIMLALATHEPHFSLLREHIDFQSFARVRSSEALVWVCLWAFVVLTRSGSRAQGRNSTKTKTKATQEVKWQLLHIGILREYLAADLRPNVPYPSFDAERAIDDFVLMTFLCGNDFIPHLPSMDIGESALNTLFLTYRDLLPKIGYLSEKGVVCRTCCCCACARAGFFTTLTLCMSGRSTRLAWRCCCVCWGPWRKKCSPTESVRRRNTRDGVCCAVGWRTLSQGLDTQPVCRVCFPALVVLRGAAGVPWSQRRRGGRGAGASLRPPSESEASDTDASDATSKQSEDPDMAIALEAAEGLGGVEAIKAKYYLQKFGLTYADEHMPVHHRLRQAYLEALHWIMLCVA